VIQVRVEFDVQGSSDEIVLAKIGAMIKANDDTDGAKILEGILTSMNPIAPREQAGGSTPIEPIAPPQPKLKPIVRIKPPNKTGKNKVVATKLGKVIADSYQEAFDSLHEVNNSLGIDAARGCILKFKVQKLGQLPKDQYPNFIKECKRILTLGENTNDK